MEKTRLEKWICQLEGLESLTRENLEQLQLRRLNETLTRVRQRQGFYRDLPERVEKLSDLKTLPFTTAEDMAETPLWFLTVSQSEISRIISGATSGTTGPAKRVFYTGRDTEHTVGFFAAGIGEMLSPGEKCMIAFPFTGPFGLGDLIAQAVERLGAIPVKAGFGGSFEELCKLVESEKPETYIGFPVSLLSLVRMYGGNIPIRRALVSADACPHGVMQALEEALGHKLYPHYGSREMCLGGAVTCPAFEGMHLRENHVIAEIIDEKGEPLPDGEWGELVITTVDMEAMPLIRYRTGDRARFLAQPCPCGGITRRLDNVSRLEEEVSMEYLDSVCFAFPGLVDMRVLLKDDTLCIRARTLDGSTEEALPEVLSRALPGRKIRVETEKAEPSHTPMYPGKRSVIRV